jgi:hypothetical protein
MTIEPKARPQSLLPKQKHYLGLHIRYELVGFGLLKMGQGMVGNVFV